MVCLSTSDSQLSETLIGRFGSYTGGQNYSLNGCFQRNQPVGS